MFRGVIVQNLQLYDGFYLGGALSLVFYLIILVCLYRIRAGNLFDAIDGSVGPSGERGPHSLDLWDLKATGNSRIAIGCAVLAVGDGLCQVQGVLLLDLVVGALLGHQVR